MPTLIGRLSANQPSNGGITDSPSCMGACSLPSSARMASPQRIAPMKARMTAAKFRNSSITHSRQASGVTHRPMAPVTKGTSPAKANPTASPGGRVALNGCIETPWLSSSVPATLSLLLPIRQARQTRWSRRPTPGQRLDQPLQTVVHPRQLRGSAGLAFPCISPPDAGVEGGIQLRPLPGQRLTEPLLPGSWPLASPDLQLQLDQTPIQSPPGFQLGGAGAHVGPQNPERQRQHAQHQ